MIKFNAKKIASDEIINCLKRDEDGDAWLFTEIHEGIFCFDSSTRKWFLWTGHFWQEDIVNDVTAAMENLETVYKKEAKNQFDQRLVAEQKDNKEKAKKHRSNSERILKRIRQLHTVKRKKAVLYLASSGSRSLAIAGDEWDKEPWLLGCQNGVIDLKKGVHRDGQPQDFIKTVAPINWNGVNEKCPQFDRFVHEIFDGHTDLIEFIQKLFGYSITGISRHHKLVIFQGKGRNGKSSLFEIIKQALGQFAYKARSELLTKTKYPTSGDSPNPEIYGLRGKRIVYVSETDAGDSLNISKIKELVGNDTLNGRAPFMKRNVEFQPSHQLFLLTNHKPLIPYNDYAFWERVILVHFKSSFVESPQQSQESEKKADLKLMDKLKCELPGILAWLVRGVCEMAAGRIRPSGNGQKRN